MRYMLYSHDTYGLGHLRRSMRIAVAVVHQDDSANVLIVTGSPHASSFGLPHGVDVVRLPAITKARSGAYETRTLGVTVDDTVRLRSGLIEATAERFRPDVLLVDHAPAGLAGELLPVLLGPARPPSVVLGLREIIDKASRVDDSWRREGVWGLLHEAYDDVVVYGDPTVRTTAQELDLDARLGVPVDHVGYVACPPVEGTSATNRCRTILVTSGGGGDGGPLVRRMLDYAMRHPRHDVEWQIVTGPFMSSRRVAQLQSAAGGIAGLQVTRFARDMEQRISASAGVVAMAGYNTTVELLSAGTPGLLFPRTAPRLEQWIRATRLSRRADLRVGNIASTTDDEISDWVEGSLATGPRLPAAVLLNGASNAASRLIGKARREARVGSIGQVAR